MRFGLKTRGHYLKPKHELVDFEREVTDAKESIQE